MTSNRNDSEKPQYSEAYLIEKEKIKTRRTRNRYVFFGVIILASLFALYFIIGKGGKGGIDVSLTEGTFKFTVDKPVVEQAKTETKTYKSPDGKLINYTTGTINKQVLNDFTAENVSFSPKYFVGENLINESAGYIISSAYPEMWHVQYNPAGLNDPLTPINTLTAADGISHLNAGREIIVFNNIQDYIESAIGILFEYGFITDYPYVDYADDGKTAFLTFTNPLNNGQSYMKVIKGNSYFYTVTANYNLDITEYNTQQELIWMVANFTLVE